MYKIINNSLIERMSDGACIPCDELNKDYIDFLLWEKEGGVIENPSPDPAYVPQEVSAGQAYAALIAAGLYDAVLAWAKDPGTDILHRLAFEKSTTFRRDSPALAAGSAALGWDESTLDMLFIEAEKINL